MKQRSVQTVTATTAGALIDQSALPASIRYFVVYALNTSTTVAAWLNTAPLDADAQAEPLGVASAAGSITGGRYFGKFALGTAVRLVTASGTADVHVVLYSLDDEV